MRRQRVRDDQAVLRIRLRDLVASRARYGYRRLHVLLKREGWQVNHKRVYRIYSEEGLTMRRKRPKRHRSGKVRVDRRKATAANEIWSMDFMSDALFGGRRIRILTIVDNFTRESLAIRAEPRFTGDGVVSVLEELADGRGLPEKIQVDNGPEFASKSLDLWAYLNGVQLDFSRPGKPTDNAVIESFNGKFREECLNQNWFLSLEEAKYKIELWRREYNEVRPHSALGSLAPSEFAVSSGQVYLAR